MAGRRHLKDPVRPTREKARADRMARRISIAATPEQRAAAAFDALRMAAAHTPERGRPALEDAAGYLLTLTAWITKGDGR